MCGEGEFVGAWDGLDDDVLFFDARGAEGADCAVHERADDAGVPAGVDYADAEGGACGKKEVLVGGGGHACGTRDVYRRIVLLRLDL